MTNKTKVLIIITIILTALIFTGCGGNNSDYKEVSGYSEYISDSDSGYTDIEYYNTDESMLNNEKAIEYYKKNSRRRGKYLITDYEDGVCINRYYGNPDWDGKIKIPEKIDDKPVVKIGSYLKDENSEYDDDKLISAFYGTDVFEIELPSTVKYLSKISIYNYCSGVYEMEAPYLLAFSVDEDNPFYTSDNGFLYDKNKEKLLFFSEKYYSLENSNFKVPESVIAFEPSNHIDGMGDYSVTLGKNVEKVDMWFDNGEDGVDAIPDFTIKGYKGTAAEQFADENGVKFLVLDE